MAATNARTRARIVSFFIVVLLFFRSRAVNSAREIHALGLLGQAGTIAEAQTIAPLFRRRGRRTALQAGTVAQLLPRLGRGRGAPDGTVGAAGAVLRSLAARRERFARQKNRRHGRHEARPLSCLHFEFPFCFIRVRRRAPAQTERFLHWGVHRPSGKSHLAPGRDFFRRDGVYGLQALMERSDTDLVALCLNGQREAFSELVVRHQHAVFNLAYRMTSNHQDAADLAQDAFIRAFRKLHSYKPAYAFRNWVMGICANLARNRFRSETRRRALEVRHAQEADPDPGPPDSRQFILEQALQRLPETTRIPLVLKYTEDLSLEDIARTLRLGLSAVKMRLARGREELLRHVRQMQAEERSAP